MTESDYNVVDISGIVRQVDDPKWKKMFLTVAIKDQDK
jgi:hypothetical protein